MPIQFFKRIVVCVCLLSFSLPIFAQKKYTEKDLAALPASGVTIKTDMVKVLDNTTAFTNTISSTSLNNPVIVTGLIPGVLYNLSVVVTSKTTASNTKTVEFKMAAK